MTRRSPRLTLAAAVAAAVLLAVAAVLFAGGWKSASASGSSENYSPGPVVAGAAQGQGVTNLRALVSVHSGKDGQAIVTGTNAAGESCWTIETEAEGSFGGAPFRCGLAPKPEGAMTVYTMVGGVAGSSKGDVVTVVGLARSDVSSVMAELTDGSTKELPVTNGGFSYSATSPAPLPTAIRANDVTGSLLEEEHIDLNGGLDDH